MASLDNFHTGNPAPQAAAHKGKNLYPFHQSDRYAVIQHDLPGTNNDVRTKIPIGPVQPYVDPLLHTGRAAPDPSYVERMSSGLNGNYVVTRPRTHLRESGDTAEHKMLIQGTTCWRNRIANFFGGGGGRMSITPINSYTRYHPYLGR
jgi:hypothetical protein